MHATFLVVEAFVALALFAARSLVTAARARVPAPRTAHSTTSAGIRNEADRLRWN
jgi:hypothetical protein